MSLADVRPTMHNHRLVSLRRAITRVAAHLVAVGGGSVLKRYEFLTAYLDDIRAYIPAVESLAALETAWTAAVETWEAQTVPNSFPLRRLLHSGLSPVHLEAVMLAALVEEDARFGSIYTALHPFPDELYLTVGLLDDLLPGHDGWQIASEAVERGLLDLGQSQRPRAARSLRVPGPVWDACSGAISRASGIDYMAPDAYPELADLDQALPADVVRRLQHAPDLLAGGQIGGLILRGMRGSGRLTALGSVARALGLGVLVVRGEHDLPERCRLLGPLALMLGALPVLALELSPGETLDLSPLAGYDGPFGVILGSEGSVQGAAVNACVTLYVPPPDLALRRGQWTRVLQPQSTRSRGFRPHANGHGQVIDDISARYHLTLGGVERAGQLAQAYAALDGREHIRLDDVQEACRALNQQSLEALATRIEAGGHWDELIVSDATLGELHNLVVRCRQREIVLEHLGAGFHGTTRGVRALLAGPSGTGKTLAARILAATLGLGLYRIDLASVVSKYIGETERNLSRLFARAEEQDVVLLLDEGNSLLTGRTDVRSSNDRYANMETNYLLQRLEHYQGIFLVTTNAPNRIDSAFQRRMDVYIEFSPPSAAQRYDIWRLHLPAAHHIDEVFLRQVAARCALSGGQIRNAAFHATILAVEHAQALGADYLTEGVAREYRKMGAASPLG